MLSNLPQQVEGLLIGIALIVIIYTSYELGYMHSYKQGYRDGVDYGWKITNKAWVDSLEETISRTLAEVETLKEK